MATRAPPTLREGLGTLLVQRKDHAGTAPEALDFDLLSVLIDQPLVGLYLIQNETFCWVNETWAANFGYRADEVIGRPITLTTTPAALGMSREYLRMREAGDAHTIHYLIEGLHRSGRSVYVESHGTRVMYRGRPAVAGVQVSITERVLRERTLERTTARLRALTRHTHEVREQQRASVARDMHDVLGGILTSLKMDVSRLARRQVDAEARQLADDILGVVQQGIDEVHRLSRDLRPALLDHLGLKAAIADALARFGARHGMSTGLETSVTCPLQDPMQQLSVFRIFQELLTNVARHAQASRVDVRLVEEGGELLLSVTDNGTGITAAEREAPTAFGILGMRERASQLGGELTIDGSPGQGTCVTLRVPSAKPEETA